MEDGGQVYWDVGPREEEVYAALAPLEGMSFWCFRYPPGPWLRLGPTKATASVRAGGPLLTDKPLSRVP
jgi:hypothetical protein